MNQEQIIEAVKKMPLSDQLQIIKVIFEEIQREKLNLPQEFEQRRKAAKLLLDDYLNDADLTAFTTIENLSNKSQKL